MKYLLQIIIAGLSFLLTSCYSDYVHLKLEPQYSQPYPVYQYGDSTKIAFVSIQKAYLRAKGITAFPGGGQEKVIYKKTGLYIFDIKSKVLTLIEDMTSSSIKPWYVMNRSKILFIDSLVYYSRKGDVLNTDEAKDPILIKQEYERCYSVDINTQKVNLADTAKFDSLYQKYYKRADLSVYKKIPLAEFGLVIQDIYSKSDEDYIEETIYLTSDGQTTRRAVIEQIISKLDKQEIETLLEKMDDYASGLEGLEKTEYEIYSKETYDGIKALL